MANKYVRLNWNRDNDTLELLKTDFNGKWVWVMDVKFVALCDSNIGPQAKEAISYEASKLFAQGYRYFA